MGSSTVQATKKDKSKEQKEKTDTKSKGLSKRRNVIESDSESSESVQQEPDKVPKEKVHKEKSAHTDGKAKDIPRKSDETLKTLEVSDKRLKIVTVQPVEEFDASARTDRVEKVRRDSGSEARAKADKVEKIRKDSGEKVLKALDKRDSSLDRKNEKSGTKEKKSDKVEKARKDSSEKVSKAMDKRDGSLERKTEKSQTKEKKIPSEEKSPKNVIDLTTYRHQSGHSPRRESEKGHSTSDQPRKIKHGNNTQQAALEKLRKIKLAKLKKAHLAAKANKSSSDPMAKTPQVAKDSKSGIKQQKFERMKQKRDKKIRKMMSARVVISARERKMADDELQIMLKQERDRQMRKWVRENKARMEKMLKERKNQTEASDKVSAAGSSLVLPPESDNREAEIWKGLATGLNLDSVMESPFEQQGKESGAQGAKRPAKEDLSNDAKRSKSTASNDDNIRETFYYIEQPQLGGFKIPKRTMSDEGNRSPVTYIPGERPQLGVRGNELFTTGNSEISSSSSEQPRRPEVKVDEASGQGQDQSRKDLLELLNSGEVQVLSDVDSQEDLHRELEEGDYITPVQEVTSQGQEVTSQGSAGSGVELTLSQVKEYLENHPDVAKEIFQKEVQETKGKEVTSQGGSGEGVASQGPGGSGKRRNIMSEILSKNKQQVRDMYGQKDGGTRGTRGSERGPEPGTSRRAEVTMDTIEHVHCMIY